LKAAQKLGFGWQQRFQRCGGALGWKAALVFGWRSASSAAVVRSLLGRCNSRLSAHNSLSLWLFAALPEMIASGILLWYV